MSLALPVGQVNVLLNQGNGAFTAPINYEVGTFAARAVLADLNGDGHPDLVVTNEFNNSSSVGALFNQGNGTFATASDYPAGARSRASPSVIPTATASPISRSRMASQVPWVS